MYSLRLIVSLQKLTNKHKNKRSMSNIELKPACVFEQFARINQIPRPSKKEEEGRENDRVSA